MTFQRVAALSCAALFALQGASHAATLPPDGSWSAFLVDDLSAQSAGVEWIDDGGAPLHFSFNIAAGFVGRLTVVDTGFSGDQYQVRDGALLLGSTGAALDGDVAGDITFSPDEALANAAFSRAVFTLGAGAHDITGVLSRSLLVDGVPLNASIGALRLEVSAVPEPASLATLLAGLSLLTWVLRRRGDSK